MKKIILLPFCFLIAQLFAQSPTLLSSGTNYKFTEGPVWDGEKNLYFNDLDNNQTIKYSTVNKTFTVILTNSLRSNGMMFNTDGNLMICEGNSGKLTKRDTTGAFISTIVDSYNGKRFNNPNDLCLDKKGGLYFSDPTWGTLYQPQNRVYYVSSTGTVIPLIFNMQKPNGLILSKDGKTLYVDDWASKDVKAYDVMEDGTISNERVFTSLKMPSNPPNNSGADGMTIDVDGNLYITSLLGIQVFDKTGTYLSTISVPESVTNCTFGGTEMKTLFITAGKNLYSIERTVAGFRHPFELDAITGIETNTNSLPTTKLWPNPVSGERVSIDLSNYDLNNLQIDLTDNTGKILTNSIQLIDNQEIKFNEELKYGIYFLQLKDNNRNETIRFLVN